MFIHKLDSIPNIDRCLHPQRVFNKYMNEYVYTECRTCAACLNAKGRYWSNRVQKECEKHRYSLFITLTYDNDHIPYYFLEDVSEVGSNKAPRYVSNFEVERGVYDVLDIPAYSADIRLRHDTLYRKYILPTFSRIHCVNFIKRVRSRIAYLFKTNHITDEQQKIRYFLCSEYGGKTLRPHYHAILWYDSATIMDNIVQILNESWPYGDVRKPELVNSSAPQYVAKYVSGSSNLPAFLRLKFTRPFHLQSKHPCIGISETDKEELRKNVLNGTYGHVEYDVTAQSPIYVQPPRSLEMSVIPKCKGYRNLSHLEKLRIYSYSFRSYERGEDYKVATFNYFDNETDKHCSYACLDFCLKHHIRPSRYVELLDDYYKNKDYYFLVKQLEYEKIYIEHLHLPAHHLFAVDPSFYDGLPDDFRDYIFSSCRYMSDSWNYSLDMIERLFYTNGRLDHCKVMESKQNYSSFGIDNANREYKELQDSNKTKVFNDTVCPEYLE